MKNGLLLLLLLWCGNVCFCQSDSKSKSFRLFGNAGVNVFSMLYTGENLITANGVDEQDNRKFMNRKSTSYLPVVGVGTQIYLNPETEKAVLLLGISGAGFRSEVNSLYKFSVYAGDEYENNYQLSGFIASFSPLIQYNFVNTKNLKYYLGVGPAMNFIIPSKNDMYENPKAPSVSEDRHTENYLFLKKFFANGSIRTGFLLNKKTDVAATISNKVQFVDGINRISAETRPCTVTVSYLFGS